VNAIQATGIYTTVANGGEHIAPSLIKGTKAGDGVIVPQAPATRTPVIQAETASTLMQMLERASDDDSSSRRAQIMGYRVAGKSGTAELMWRDRPNTIMASFIGVAPADDPMFTVSVFVHAPTYGIYGGVVAAPAFSEVMSYVLNQQQVPLSTPNTNPLPICWGPNTNSDNAGC
jgi:cell division protein FtsI (penicillin-binding protein 3)